MAYKVEIRIPKITESVTGDLYLPVEGSMRFERSQRTGLLLPLNASPRTKDVLKKVNQVIQIDGQSPSANALAARVLMMHEIHPQSEVDPPQTTSGTYEWDGYPISERVHRGLMNIASGARVPPLGQLRKRMALALILAKVMGESRIRRPHVLAANAWSEHMKTAIWANLELNRIRRIIPRSQLPTTAGSDPFRGPVSPRAMKYQIEALWRRTESRNNYIKMELEIDQLKEYLGRRAATRKQVARLLRPEPESILENIRF